MHKHTNTALLIKIERKQLLFGNRFISIFEMHAQKQKQRFLFFSYFDVLIYCRSTNIIYILHSAHSCTHIFFIFIFIFAFIAHLNCWMNVMNMVCRTRNMITASNAYTYCVMVLPYHMLFNDHMVYAGIYCEFFIFFRFFFTFYFFAIDCCTVLFT